MSTPTDQQVIDLAEQHGIVWVDRPSGDVLSGKEDVDIRKELIAFARALLAAPSGPKHRESAGTLAAIADVEAGAPVAPSARKHGIQPSTLFRALKRRREAEERPSAPTPSTACR